MPNLEIDLPGAIQDRRSGSSAPVVALAVGAIAAGVAIWLVARGARTQWNERGARGNLAAFASNERRTGQVAATPIEGGDDLTVIEGIGPRYEAVLKGAGVMTYAQLAALRPARIQTILRESGGRLTDPTTWPQQARLAAAGRWQELTELQGKLKRGRRRER